MGPILVCSILLVANVLCWGTVFCAHSALHFLGVLAGLVRWPSFGVVMFVLVCLTFVSGLTLDEHSEQQQPDSEYDTSF